MCVFMGGGGFLGDVSRGSRSPLLLHYWGKTLKPSPFSIKVRVMVGYSVVVLG